MFACIYYKPEQNFRSRLKFCSQIFFSKLDFKIWEKRGKIYYGSEVKIYGEDYYFGLGFEYLFKGNFRESIFVTEDRISETLHRLNNFQSILFYLLGLWNLVG